MHRVSLLLMAGSTASVMCACGSTPAPYPPPLAAVRAEARASSPARVFDVASGGIVAWVNGHAITDWDLEQELPLPFRDRSQWNLPRSAELLRRTLQRLVEERVLVDAAQAEDIRVPESAIDEEARKEREQASMTPESFRQHVETQSGRPYAIYVERIKERLMVQELIRRRVYSGALVPQPAELLGEFRRNPGGFVEEETVTYQRIVVSSSDAGGSAQAQDRAAAIRRQVGQGSDFVSLARLYERESDQAGRIYENALRGSLPATVEGVLFKLGVNELSPVLPYDEDWAVFRVLARRERRQKAFEDLQLQLEIHRGIFNDRFNRKRREILAELMLRARIEPTDLFPPGYFEIK